VRQDGPVRIEIGTARGLAWADVERPADGGAPACLLVLGHGAGGGLNAPDLVAVRRAALGTGVATAMVTQPYRVAGRRAPAPAGQLDEAWTAVLERLRQVEGLGGAPLVVGGRSSGARVACRTAVATGAVGIVALAFPTHPPGRPERSRVDELRTGLPTLIVNGDRDPFGVPPALPGVDLLIRPGERHDLRGAPAEVGDAVVGWLRQRGWAR
jgi:predicted alpha/beta-hydrolase family hydrolase